MKIIIEDCPFIYQVDWAMKNKIEDRFLEEYRPALEESIESFLQLLENIYPKAKIAAYIKKGIQYSAMPPEIPKIDTNAPDGLSVNYLYLC